MTSKIDRRLFLTGSAVATIAALLSPKAFALTNLEKIKEGLLGQAEETHGDDIEDLDDSGVRRLTRNIQRVALDVEDHDEVADHILDEWYYGDASRGHLRKCPTCNYTAEEIARGTGLSRNVPELRVPQYFAINGVLYFRDNDGLLYPAHPQTGQVVGPAHGYIWYTGTSYAGVGFNGRTFRADPVS